MNQFITHVHTHSLLKHKNIKTKGSTPLVNKSFRCVRVTQGGGAACAARGAVFHTRWRGGGGGGGGYAGSGAEACNEQGTRSNSEHICKQAYGEAIQLACEPSVYLCNHIHAHLLPHRNS